jgi:small-conductance mechanosensitive channel
MEQLQFDKQRCLQQAAADACDEIHQLKAAIRGLREEMENAAIRHREEIQELKLAAREEQNHFRETIAALRAQLEKQDAG